MKVAKCHNPLLWPEVTASGLTQDLVCLEMLQALEMERWFAQGSAQHDI